MTIVLIYFENRRYRAYSTFNYIAGLSSNFTAHTADLVRTGKCLSMKIPQAAIEFPTDMTIS